MAVMIKLRLPETLKSFEAVQTLQGLADLKLDDSFGLIPINPKESLYVVRTASIKDDMDERRKLSPEIIEAYGDIKISPTTKKREIKIPNHQGIKLNAAKTCSFSILK